MSRRRSAPLKPGTVMAAILVCAAVCLSGIGYIWAKTQVWTLGREMKALELRLDELRRANDGLSRTYAAMCTPRALEERMKRYNLGLVAPQPDQMVRLPEPTLVKREVQTKIYAAGGGR
jgi:hypothetical protein